MRKNETTKNTKTKVAVYCRVSTYEQAQGNISSLDGQEGNIKDYCKQRGWEIYKVYRDTKSGKSLEREEIQKLLADAEEKKFDIVIATKLDRISRSLIDFLQFDSRVKALGIDTVITTQNLDTSTPQGKLQRDIMLVFAEFEREMIAERTREKMYYQASKGYWNGGYVPLGYDVIEKKLVVNDNEAKLVKMIFTSYLEGKSFGEVAEELNKAGYKPKERKIKGKLDGVGDFNKDSIGRILKNTLYLGIIEITRKEDGEEKTERFKGLHTAIIDQEIFDKVNTRINESVVNKFINYKKSELLLLNKIKCGFCGSAMTTSFASRNGERYYYYKCSEKMKHNAKKCLCKDIAAEEIEDFVLKLVNQIGKSDVIFDSVFKQITVNDDAEEIKLKEKITDLKRNLSKCTQEKKNLLQFVSGTEKIGNMKETENMLNSLQTTQDYIEDEIKKSEEQLLNIHSEEVDKKELRETFREVTNSLYELDKQGKRELIDALINEIRWHLKSNEKEGEVEILFRGNGGLKNKWASKADPSSLVSSFELGWLRG